MGTMTTVAPRRRLGPQNGRVVSDPSMEVRRQVARQALRAALPRAAKCYGVSPWLLNNARETGGPLLALEQLVGVADRPEEIEAHLRARFLMRAGEVAGTMGALRECARRDAYCEAEDRVTTTELLAVLESDAPVAEKLKALDEAQKTAEADAAQEIRKAAVIQKLRERLRQTRGGGA